MSNPGNSRPAITPIPGHSRGMASSPRCIVRGRTICPYRIPAPAGLHIGSSVRADALQTDPAYARLLAREFNLVTPENAMKFSVVQPERGRFDFAQADALVEFSEANGMQVNGHVLVWHSSSPTG